MRPRHLYTLLLCLLPAICSAQTDSTGYALNYEAATEVNVGSGEFAPYYMASNRAGTLTQPITIMERAKLYRPMNLKTRFSYGFGIDAAVDYSKSTNYERWNAAAGEFYANPQHPARAWLQQLYAEVKYRGVFLMAGMKENDRSIFDGPLSTGDLTLSNNARPVPQVRLGFVDFQNIPFTNGWVQIQGEVAYGKFVDNDWLRNHYNYYNSFITTGVWMHYKRCYFRTNPNQRFSFTIGLQHAAQFGGYSEYYRNGEVYRKSGGKVKFKDFVDVFVQKRGKAEGVGGDAAYYYGNHLGSWDVQMRYRFNWGDMTLYIQSPWEDGSGIGKLNGWDGVWGLKYEANNDFKWVKSAVVEYFDFMNQSGPMHWAPSDHTGTQVPGSATGSDDYYNNFMYNGWAYYGMGLGTPLLKSPIYNTDGYLRYTDNRVRGFHIGVMGTLFGKVDYRLLGGYRMSLGTPYIPSPKKHHDTSMMLEGIYNMPKVPGLSIKGQIAFDAGDMYGNNFGVLCSVTYRGLLTFGKR